MTNWFKYFLLTSLFQLFSFQGSSQKLHPFSTLTNTYTGEVNQFITVNKFISDSLGNTFLSLKILDKLSVKKTKVPCLLNDKIKAPYYQIIKLNKQGEYVWGLSSNTPIADIACDTVGNLYFCANDPSELKNNKLVFFQSSSVIIAENTNNILAKFSPDGDFLWSKKMKGEFYMPRTILRVGYDGKLYCVISKNGTRMMDHTIICLDLHGREEWRTDIFNQYIDVFEIGPDGKSYLAGFDYKVDDKKIVIYPFEIARYVLLEIDENGTPKKLFDKKFNFETEVKFRQDYYINQISFDTSNNPLFAFCASLGSETPEMNIANKKYRKNDGEFVFVQTNKKGDIILDYQLKTGTNISSKAIIAEGSMGLKKNIGITFTKNNTWLICTPTATSISYKEKKYELLGKTDLIYFELDPGAIKDKIKWISTASTGKQFTSTPFITSLSDSTFFVSNLSDKKMGNVQGAYADLRILEIKIKKKPKPIEEKEEETIETVEDKSTNIEIDETEFESDSTMLDSLKNDSIPLQVSEEKETVQIEKEIEVEKVEEVTETNNTEIDVSVDSTKTKEDSVLIEEPEEPLDVHALKVQLTQMPTGGTMLLEINKIPDDSLKSSRMVEVKIEDESGSSFFPGEKEYELESNQLQFNIDIAKWPRGVYRITVNVAGKDNAEMKIVKI